VFYEDQHAIHTQGARMMKPPLKALIAILLLSMSPTVAAPQLPEPILVGAALPKPSNDGEVTASFVLNANGDVISVEIENPERLLDTTTIENIRSWKFQIPHDLYRTEWRYETTFRYHSREVADLEPEKLTVVFESFHRVDVTQDYHKISGSFIDVPYHKVRSR
jgi:hypothetical protein